MDIMSKKVAISAALMKKQIYREGFNIIMDEDVDKRARFIISNEVISYERLTYSFDDQYKYDYINELTYSAALPKKYLEQVYDTYGNISEESCKDFIFKALKKSFTEIVELVSKDFKHYYYMSSGFEWDQKFGKIFWAVAHIEGCKREDVVIAGYTYAEYSKLLDTANALNQLDYIIDKSSGQAKPFHSIDEIHKALTKCVNLKVIDPRIKQVLEIAEKLFTEKQADLSSQIQELELIAVDQAHEETLA